MEYLIGLDIGTSAVKGALMTENGKVIDTVTKEFEYFGEGNQRLSDPELFIKKCFSVIRDLASLKGENHIAAISFCHASGNLLLLDKDDKPIIPIIGWQTTVSKEEMESFFTKEEIDDFYYTAGWPFGPYFPAAYLASIKIHRPEILEKTKTVTMSGEYLNYRLCGKWGISNSVGTTFYLIDQEKGEYSAHLLEKLGIADKFLPPIFSKGTVLGEVLPEIAKDLKLDNDTKVVLGSFDHPSGAMGAGVFEEGEMLLSCGTSWVEFFPVSSRKFAISTKGLVDRFMLDGAPYCVMKSIASVSEKINALRKHYLGEISHKEFDELASASSIGCGGLKFDFTEEDYNLSENYGKNDIARAIIESAAIILKDNLSSLRACGLKADKITMIGGITNSKVCVNIISEILEMPIKVVNGQVAGAVGSCLLAGIGAGIYKNEKDAFCKADF